MSEPAPVIPVTPPAPVSPPVAPPAPAAPAKPSLPKRILRSVVAVVTSPDVVKKEKSLAVLVIGRLLISAGASAGLAELITKLAG